MDSTDWIYPAILATLGVIGTAWKQWLDSRERLELRRFEAEERRASEVVPAPPPAPATAPSDPGPPDGSSPPSTSPPSSPPAPSS